jgi:CRP/FNR family transcriptional regulator, cyclic AMP receptor protein
VERERLAAIRLFADLSEEELDALVGVARELELEEGQTLAQEGDFGHCIFAIESGTALVRQGDETLGSVGPGDVVGEIAVLASGRRSASVVATSPMRALSFFKRDVWALDEEAPEASRRLRELIATREAAGSPTASTPE